MKNCNVKNYGAAGDGIIKDTTAIQTAIDDCAAHGGGRVVLSEGSFLSGMIRLKDGVELYIERDAILLGSTNGLDYPEIQTDFWKTEFAPRFNKRCFIYAEGCRDIAITGRGTIDCQGENYIFRLPENQKGMWPFARKPHPELPGDDQVDPFIKRVRSLSPARVVFFMGCRNVLVEDITLRNQPAGWGYWVCDCEDVHFSKAKIQASVLYPNNDGIHINCSRNVTVSDCNITCGDDGIVVRAYSAPLYQNAVCEKIAVTNCNITSHSGGIRIGWYDDGIMRNCTFSNLNITDSTVGIDLRLPNVPEDHRGSDQGVEDTLVENLSFSNITMDRIFYEPIYIWMDDHNRCEGIRNLYFSNIHAYSVHMPTVSGRENRPIKNIYFDNCHFRRICRESIPEENVGPYCGRDHTLLPYFHYVENLCMVNTVFDL